VDILADTNILLRGIHRGDPQYRQTRDPTNRLRSDGHRLCVTSQNLIELWAVCTRPLQSNGLGLTPVHDERVLGQIESSVVRLRDLDGAYPEWKGLVAQFGVSGKTTHDVRLVAAMNVHGVKRILTFNSEDFTRTQKLRYYDPWTFSTASSAIELVRPERHNRQRRQSNRNTMRTSM